jgi:branched-chain amino acid transport system permease protein
LPFVLQPYYLGLVVKILILALFAMSLDLMIGYSGMASLGHAAYFGIAAYAAGLLAQKLGWNLWLAMPAALLLAGFTALIFGLLAMRTRGAYLLMITLALSQLIWGIAVGWRSLTGGSDGLPNVPRPDLMPLFSLDNEASFYYFVLIAVCLAGLLLVRIVASPFGYALRGIRESESRMLALGYDVKKFRLLVFVMSAIFAALAGVLYVYFNRFVSPDFLHVERSAEVLLMVILGGTGTLIGPVVGAAAIVTLENIAGTFTERWLMILGSVYIVVALFAPSGLVGLVKRLVNGRAAP